MGQENEEFKDDNTDKSVKMEYLKLPDPFKKRIKDKRNVQLRPYDTIMVNNSYSNIPQLGKVPVDSIMVVGIVLGEKRLAQAKVIAGKGKGATPGETIYDLYEGMKIGENNSEIKAILPGGIVVVEKIKNIYNEYEHIETVIPLTGDI